MRQHPILFFLLIIVCHSFFACHEYSEQTVGASTRQICGQTCTNLDLCGTLYYRAGATSTWECEQECEDNFMWVESGIPECIAANDALESCLSALASCEDIDSYFNGYPDRDVYPCVAEDADLFACEQEHSEGFFHTGLVKAPPPANP